ncbi:permease component of ABC-type sugar transporter [Halobacteroides halobius DSM 5150]|uniref:Permease component of ABC-type sugar transporter n=1 Tax=Halobacteroides halobius (strain ATCC 35273 / DSM 5150 / MD-1) TaxID=748449 RepID=L0K4S3_HALHC|nr:sugar ABC transporter permease [Halobacteroides halobius]AGB40267.1 permease component of ABC-type sugar transporter [Halobacteroides halobius DSM 5150]
MRLSKKVAPYLFVSPFYILFAIFGAFPILFSLFLSFHQWNGLSPMQFVGLENYIFALTDPWFWKSISNTLIIFVLTTIPQHIIALFLAFILNSGVVKFKEFFRSSYFLPYITSSVAVSLIFMTLLGKNYGILNAILQSISSFPPIEVLFNLMGVKLPIGWLSDPEWLKVAIASLVTWKFTGWNMIIYYAGIQKIPNSLYEAAKVDGASLRDQFFNITLPLLRPVIFFGVTMSIIGNLRIFAEPMILTGGSGGPGQSGLTTAMYLYKTGFEWTQFGLGSAMAYILCAIIIILSIINNKFFSQDI